MTVSDNVVSVPMRPSGANRARADDLVPCTIEAAWLGRSVTHLAVLITCPPVLCNPADRALLHRVAEAGALHFLNSAADHLLTLTDG